jgi:hypothetical protein
MLDTIKFRTNYENPCSLSREKVYERSLAIAKKKKLKTLQVSKSDAGTVRFSFSIPEALYGSSVYEYSPGDAERLVSFIAELNMVMEIDTAGLLDYQLTRVDLCRNMRMSGSPMQYVAQFAQYSKPPRWSRSVYIPPFQAGFRKNKNHWIGCYDKGKKNRKSAPLDMLRWEMQLTSREEIRKVVGISTLGDIINLSPAKVTEILTKEFLLITGGNLEQRLMTPDIDGLWKLALAKGEKRAAPIFAINFLLSVGQFEPIHIALFQGFLRNTLKFNFRHFYNTYLKNCDVGSFNNRFVDEVIRLF